ncbi:hypothetical protein GCM10023092_16850 [Rurimicrobium arvi]|uniref:T9SS type A sorting domain-containing protein n=1 Tax=Rurimicrobium arvi TaxID=2049916 RepID=A0ABP8MUF4_9BACT
MYTHKKIKIRIKVFQEIVGAVRNYTPSDEYMIINFINKANEYLASVPAPSDPLWIGGRNPHVSDSRFQLELATPVEFSKAEEIYKENVEGGVGIDEFYKPDEILNIFLVFSEPDADIIPGGIAFDGPNVTDILNGLNEGYPHIVLKNFYKDPATRGQDEKCATYLLHEIGHLFGMCHTYCKDWGKPTGTACSKSPELGIEGHFDDLTDVFGITASPAGRIFPRPYDCGSYPTINPFTDPASPTPANDRFTNNFMGGNNKGHYMSPLQLGRMHRNAHFTAIRKYLYPLYPENRNHDHVGQGQLYPLVITGNENWDFDIKMYSDIVVKPGAKLTITCRVAMPYHANIIVEPGGELVLDGGTITSDRNDDEYFWYGISVLGKSNRAQTTAYQGKVRVINGGTIKNALHGIVAGDEVFGTSNSGGGIIEVNGGQFVNNKRSIGFWPYHDRYSMPGFKWPSHCFILNSSFSWDDNYHLNSKVIDRRPSCGISLCDVDMVQIRGSVFKNNMSVTKRTIIMDIAAGLLSWTASYNTSENTFYNMLEGIKAEGVRSEPVYVNNSDFNYNIRGILVNGTLGARILNSRFNVYGLGYAPSPHNSAVWLYGVNAFDVGYNSFFKTLPDGSTTGPGTFASGYGVRVDQCSPGNNSVHHNSFARINTHCMSYGRNTNGTYPLDKDNTGLEFRCNLFDKTAKKDHYADIFVTGSNPATDGIRTVQGRYDRPAGNDFANSKGVFTSSPPSTTNILMQETGSAPGVTAVNKYYYSTTDPGRMLPTKYTTSLVTVVPLALSSGCDAPTFGPGGTEGTIGGAGSTTTLTMLNAALTDSTGDRVALVANAYNGMKSPYAAAELSFFYVGEGMVQQAQSTYASVFTSTDWTLDLAEQSEFQMGAILLRMAIAHSIDSIPDNQLDSVETDSLHYITANAQTWPRAKACGWLHFALGEECDMYDPQIPDNTDTAGSNRFGGAVTDSEQDAFAIHPNPVGGQFTIACALDKTARLQVSDAYGRRVLDLEIKPTDRNLNVSSASWTPGMYFYRLVQDRKVIRYGKISKL